MPHLDEAGVRLGLDRLDLAAQRGQRTATQLSQHLGIAVLATDATGSELAMHDAIRSLERGEGAGDPLDGRRKPPRHIGCRERAMRAGVARD